VVDLLSGMPQTAAAPDLLHPAGLSALAGRIERAQAAQNASIGGDGAMPLAGGVVVFAGPGSPLTQAVALGIGVAVSPEELDRAERHMGQAPGPMQIETCPFTDPGLLVLLARRGYRVAEFQQVLARRIPGPGWQRPDGVEVRPIRGDEGQTFVRLVCAAFLNGAEPTEEQLGWMMPTTRAPGTTCIVALIEGVPVGAATVAVSSGVATLSGAGVLPEYRRRGVQSALISARMEAGSAAGCDIASSSTWTGTTSQRNLERLGFRIAYPKVVLVRDAPEANPAAV
jgi:ribosomal protein S18 acetylase RimI-like enzyme